MSATHVVEHTDEILSIHIPFFCFDVSFANSVNFIESMIIYQWYLHIKVHFKVQYIFNTVYQSLSCYESKPKDAAKLYQLAQVIISLKNIKVNLNYFISLFCHENLIKKLWHWYCFSSNCWTLFFSKLIVTGFIYQNP